MATTGRAGWAGRRARYSARSLARVQAAARARRAEKRGPLADGRATVQPLGRLAFAKARLRGLRAHAAAWRAEVAARAADTPAGWSADITHGAPTRTTAGRGGGPLRRGRKSRRMSMRRAAGAGAFRTRKGAGAVRTIPAPRATAYAVCRALPGIHGAGDWDALASLPRSTPWNMA